MGATCRHLLRSWRLGISNTTTFFRATSVPVGTWRARNTREWWPVPMHSRSAYMFTHLLVAGCGRVAGGCGGVLVQAAHFHDGLPRVAVAGIHVARALRLSSWGGEQDNLRVADSVGGLLREQTLSLSV
jgi:hypothetical protein